MSFTRTFGTAFSLSTSIPTDTYTQSAAAYNQWMEEKYPSAQHRQIADRPSRKDDGDAPVCGWNPTSTCPMANHWSVQLLIGKSYFKDKFGVACAHRMEPGFLRL